MFPSSRFPAILRLPRWNYLLESRHCFGKALSRGELNFLVKQRLDRTTIVELYVELIFYKF